MVLTFPKAESEMFMNGFSSEMDYLGNSVNYQVTTGLVKVESSTDEELYIAVAVANTAIKNKQEQLTPGR